MEKKTYCVVCKKNVPIHDINVVQTKNNRYRLTGKCQKNHKISKFISLKEGEGLISGLLGYKDGFPLLRDIPIIGKIL